MENLIYLFDIIIEGWWILLISGIMAVLFGISTEDENDYESLEDYYHPRGEDIDILTKNKGENS